MERGGAEKFTQMGTLGIEEEFFVVDECGRPTAGSDALVYESELPEILTDRLDHELLKTVIETQTPLIDSLGDAEETLYAVRNALLDHAENNGYGIAAAGLHPFANWRELEHAQKPRYRSQLDRLQYPQHRNTTAGLHVHVGVDDADKAMWIVNEIRWDLSVLLALSANSPYWNGFDTGLQSARATIFESLPNTGVPTAFDSYEEFDRFEQTMLERDAIKDRGELWYDVRPHSGLGTVEVRVPDAQRDPDYVLAFTEYVDALVEDLAARYEDGESNTAWRRELLEENKWRATRFGHGAELLTREFDETRELSELVDRAASRLNTTAPRDLFDRESGACAQRRIHRDEGPEALRETLLIDRV